MGPRVPGAGLRQTGLETPHLTLTTLPHYPGEERGTLNGCSKVPRPGAG